MHRRVIAILLPSGFMYVFAGLFEYLGIVAFVVLCFVLIEPWERLLHLVALGRQADKDART